MPDYKKMYITLFNETARVITILQQAQQKTEEVYISSDTPGKPLLIPKDGSKDKA